MAEVKLPDYQIITTNPQRNRVFANADTRWGITYLRAREVEIEPTGPGVLYFVLDTEGNAIHPDVQQMMEPRYNRSFTGEDNSGLGHHGLHVADTYRQMMDAAKAGGRTRFVLVKGLRNNGFGSSTQIVQGIDYIKDAPLFPEYEGWIKLLNLSLGADVPLPDVKAALQRFEDAGGVVVAASGNDGVDINYPAAWEELCIAVASINSDGVPSGFSSPGDAVDLAGPGEFIEAAWEEDEYAVLNGTSMATPHIGGAVSIMILKNFDALKNQREVEEYAQAGATDLYLSGFDQKSGWGAPVLPPYFDAEPPPPPPPPPDEEPGGGIPVWAVIVILSVIIVGIILFLIFNN